MESKGIGRDELDAFLRDVLAVDGFVDYGPNGLQIEGRERIHCIGLLFQQLGILFWLLSCRASRVVLGFLRGAPINGCFGSPSFPLGSRGCQSFLLPFAT